MTLRLPADLHERLQAVADIDEQSVADVVRTAVAQHVERRRQAPDFQARVDDAIARQQRLLALLEEPIDG